MNTSTIRVYHTTAQGNGKNIVKDGWIVSQNIATGRLYGTGIYFWELEKDAHVFGEKYFPNGYDIILEKIPYRKYLFYDTNKRLPNNEDAILFSKQMLAKGIELLIIPRAYIDNTTMQAQGKAFVWLVDINKHELIVK